MVPFLTFFHNHSLSLLSVWEVKVVICESNWPDGWHLQLWEKNKKFKVSFFNLNPLMILCPRQTHEGGVFIVRYEHASLHLHRCVFVSCRCFWSTITWSSSIWCCGRWSRGWCWCRPTPKAGWELGGTEKRERNATMERLSYSQVLATQTHYQMTVIIDAYAGLKSEDGLRLV